MLSRCHPCTVSLQGTWNRPLPLTSGRGYLYWCCSCCWSWSCPFMYWLPFHMPSLCLLVKTYKKVLTNELFTRIPHEKAQIFEDFPLLRANKNTNKQHVKSVFFCVEKDAWDGGRAMGHDEYYCLILSSIGTNTCHAPSPDRYTRALFLHNKDEHFFHFHFTALPVYNESRGNNFFVSYNRCSLHARTRI